MITGIILRGVGSFYDVVSDGEIHRCRARGKFRKLGLTPMVGDHVVIEPETDITEGFLIEILPRKNTLSRPAVANIDHLAVVLSVTSPDPDLLLVDKLLVTAERNGIEPLLIINKIDLGSQEDLNVILEEYQHIGYPIYCVSGKFNTGMDRLSKGLKGITTLAGQSGVGKSSIINKLRPDIQLETGSLSRKNQRGRHTTRHVELINLPHGGMIVDTPGFSQMELMDFDPIELQDSYPDFQDYRYECRFNGCLHVTEPDCMVREKAEDGTISKGRYDRYIILVEEIKENRRNQW